MRSDAAPIACPACTTPLHGPWCHACGQRADAAVDLSLRGFLLDAGHSLTDADSRLWRSLRALVVDPARLTRDWAAGRRRPWIPPLRLFLLINVVYFLSQSLTGFNTFTTPLEVHLTGLPHAEVARDLVRTRMADREEDYNVFRARFDDAATTQAKTLVILLVPFFALIVAALERRRPFAVHLVFALHAIAFLMLMAALLDPLAVALARVAPDLVGEISISVVYGTLLAVNLYLAFRHTADRARPAALLRTLLALTGLVALLYLYRLSLFFTVFYTI